MGFLHQSVGFHVENKNKVQAEKSCFFLDPRPELPNHDSGSSQIKASVTAVSKD